MLPDFEQSKRTYRALLVLCTCALLTFPIVYTEESNGTASSNSQPRGKGQHTLYTGISVQRHVPTNILPTGDIVKVCIVTYRLIGPDAQFSLLETTNLGEKIRSTWSKFQTIPAFDVELNISRASIAKGTVVEDCSDSSGIACFLSSFKAAENYFALDIHITTGISRQTKFPDIGEKEWTYNRMLETMLNNQGIVARVVLRKMTILEEGIHVFKHLPFTALYSEETVIQLEGMDLLPFGAAKQNLVEVALDLMGLNKLLGVGWLELAAVSEEWLWTPARGSLGQANITLLTMRDRTASSLGEVLAEHIPLLLDYMDEAGLPRTGGRVLSSRPIAGHSPQDQMAEMLGPDETVRSYDTRDPKAVIAEFPAKLPEKPWLVIAVSSLLSIAAVAGSLWYLRAQRRKWLEASSHKSGIYPPSLLKKESGSSLNAKLRSRNSLLRRNSSTSQTSLQLKGQASDGAVNLDNASLFGDSSPESPDSCWRILQNNAGGQRRCTAGLVKLSEARKRAQLISELERAASLKGWEIASTQISICKHPDGSDWMLGAGGYGQVYKGLKSGVQDVAVKVLAYSEDLEAHQFWVEINLLKSLSFDRNIVQFYGCVLDEAHPMLVLELMEGGDLRAALSGPQAQQMAWYQRGRELALDIVRGICYLHENRVIHGDLKSKNVLLARNGATAKISDVGMSRVMATTLATRDQPRGPPGTFAYAAPEMLLGQRCTFKADIFSLGVTLWEICTRGVPSRGQMRNIRVPEECPERVRQLIDQCMLSYPEDRPTAKEVFDVLRGEHATLPDK